MVWSTIIHKDNPTTFQNNHLLNGCCVGIWKTTPKNYVGLLLLVVFPICCWLLYIYTYMYIYIYILAVLFSTSQYVSIVWCDCLHACWLLSCLSFHVFVIGCVSRLTGSCLLVLLLYLHVDSKIYTLCGFIQKNYQKSEAVILNLQHPCLVYLHIHLPELLTTSSTIW